MRDDDCYGQKTQATKDYYRNIPFPHKEEEDKKTETVVKNKHNGLSLNDSIRGFKVGR